MGFDEDNFIEKIESFEDDTFETIDLHTLNNNLEKFRKEIGKISVYKIFTCNSVSSLNFYIYEDWWLEFVDITFEAIQEANIQKTQKVKKIEEEKKEKEKDLIKEIKKLQMDVVFRTLKTQRAMTTYAKENIEGINDLDPAILRKEIQNLYDKILF